MSTDDTKSRGHGDKRSRKLDEFISALLAHSSVDQAAKVAGVSRASAHRWLRDPAVVQRLTEARRDATKAIMAKLRLAAAASVDCLSQIQRDGESESARVSAARCILEQVMHAAEIQDLAERIDKLEQAAKLRKGANDEQQRAYAEGGTLGRVNGRA